MAYKLRVKNIFITNKGIPLAGPEIRTKKVQIVAPSSNAGAVYYGSRGMTGGIWRTLAAGATDTHEAPGGGEIDLSALRFDAANNNDKVTLIYYEWTEAAEPELLLPNQVDDLLAWRKADAITGLNHNQSIVTVPDSSGNGNTLGGGGAVYKTNVRNGLPGIYYDGVNDGTDGTIEYGVSTNFFVLDLSLAGTLYWGEGGSNEDFIGGDEDGFYVYASRDGDLKIERTYDTAVMTEPKILMVRLGATAQECQVLVNGAEPTASNELTLDLGTTSFERTEWFGYRDGDYPIGGFVFEHALFNRALTDEEVAGLLVGLNDKWAIY